MSELAPQHVLVDLFDSDDFPAPIPDPEATARDPEGTWEEFTKAMGSRLGWCSWRTSSVEKLRNGSDELHGREWFLKQDALGTPRDGH
jgi:hypothetical protein